jgi:hypothetical protein
MKKYPYLVIAVVTVLLLAACSSTAIEPTSDGTVSTAPITPVAPDIIPPESTEPSQTESESMVLVDNESICVKITGAETDPIWGYTVHVYLENKTDQDLLFTVDNVAVNRYMCDPFWAESVAAGMKSNSSISWFESEFEENGIESVEEIRFTLRVYDSKNFSAEDVFQGSFTIQP